MDFKRLTDAIFSRLEPYQLARHYKFAELIYTDGEDLPASWCDGELRPVLDEREWNEGIMYIRQNGQHSIREDETSAFIGCQVMQIGTIPLKLVLIARRSERFTPFDVAQTISSAVSGMYSNLALQIGAQYVNVINTVTESNARVVLEDEFKDLERVSFDSHLYAISVEIEVEVKGDAACMASDACDPIFPEPVLSKVATPVFAPSDGVFGGFGEFTLSCSTPGASIYYTLDGSPVTPQTGILYTGTPVLVVTSTVPKAKAFLNGLVDSDTATAQFQIDLLTLSFNIAGGVFPIDSPPTIVPIINNQDADVYYTTDGSEPTELSTPFTSPFVPTPNVTLKARGFLAPALPSNIVSETYQFRLNAPVLDTVSGTYISERLVSATPAAIGVNEYRIDGGSWVVGDSVLVQVSSVVDWRAVEAGYVTSDITSVNITIQCAAPTISPNGGVVGTLDPITLATATSGAQIYYTTNGSEPTQSSTLYTGTFTLSANATVRAKAFKSGTLPSDITSAAFTTIDADAAAFLNAAGITDETQREGIALLVDGLKADATWAKLRGIFPVVGGGADNHKYNLKDPRDLDAAFRLSFIGGWVHNSNGMQANGTDGYARTFFSNDIFNTSTGMSGGVFLASSRDFNAGNNYRAYLTFTNTFSIDAFQTNQRWLAGAQAASVNLGTSGNNIGLWALSFRRATALDTFLRLRPNGTIDSSNSTVNSISPVGELFLSARNQLGTPDGFAAERITFAFFGEYLTPTDLTNIRTRILAFQAYIGR